MIRCFTKKRQDSWDVHLQQLTGAIRATENRQTGFTPNFMVFGKENIQPIDLVLGLDAPNRTREQKKLTDYIKILRETLTEVHDLARENIKMAQWRQKRDYDLNVNCKVYKVGDTVFKIDSARKVGVCPKLKATWKGPFVVAEAQEKILENVERKMLEDLTDKEEQCDLGLDWLFSNNEQMSGNMMDSSFAQSDSLTVGSNTGIGQSDFLTNKRSSQEAEQFTLQDWETLMNLDDNFGDQTIIYNVADTVEAQVKLSERNRGRDRKAPAHFKDFIMD
ncbi:Hypothetical predicted protein [Mytilus galloprovincialis]|uniref:Uncharacterized protein n=1 Tax=Mytilus galloprovincialis TaxID=29158 RepID=A0A8B6DFT6_MYTGA|nr:Hypothetical predicted protein [Mytilus galloprovincialis]